jgi:GNAT superfamily N-acetyltransferase
LNRLEYFYKARLIISMLLRKAVSLGMLAIRVRENLWAISRYCEISIIALSSTANRKGIGRQLMSFAEQKAEELNFRALS